MALRQRLFGLVLLVWLTLSLAVYAGVPNNSPAPTPAGGIAPSVVDIPGHPAPAPSVSSAESASVRTIVFVYAGKRYSVPASPAADGEFLLRADDKELARLAKDLGASLHWDKRQGAVVKRDGKKHCFALQADTLPASAGGRRLDVVGREIGGHPFIPMTAAGDLDRQLWSVLLFLPYRLGRRVRYRCPS